MAEVVVVVAAAVMYYSSVIVAGDDEDDAVDAVTTADAATTTVEKMSVMSSSERERRVARQRNPRLWVAHRATVVRAMMAAARDGTTTMTTGRPWLLGTVTTKVQDPTTPRNRESRGFPCERTVVVGRRIPVDF